MDHIQADLYLWITEELDMNLNDRVNPSNHLKYLYNNLIKSIIANGELLFHYLVIGIKKYPLDNQIKLLERLREESPNNQLRRKELIERLKRSIAVLEEYAANQYPVRPSASICKKCTVNKINGGYCTASDNIEKI
jgi:hypothetical protein